jgi:PHD/YefM family antitoxin component YafN of YafNO toxin-antitoxin module
MANVTELKAQAYDLLANIEFLQLKLRETNAAIAEETKKQNESGSTVSNDSN